MNDQHELPRNVDVVTIDESRTTSSTSLTMNIIVIDGVWRRARKLAKHLFSMFPNIPRVQLTPEQLSVYARTQSQDDRICSVEATALFLSHCGEDKEKRNQLIECVKLNNMALKRKKKATVVTT